MEEKARIHVQEIRVDKKTKDTMATIANTLGMTMTKFIAWTLENFYNQYEIDEFLRDYYINKLNEIREMKGNEEK